MRGRLFKLVFLAAMLVYLICSGIVLIGLAGEVDFVELFIPMLAALVVAVGLSAFLASKISKTVTKSLNHIDFSSPDERDVEEEIKPLVRRLAEQNKQIRSQMEALGQEHARQDKLRREFTANVSHELKTPLTSISGFADLMRSGMVKPEDVPRFAGKIYEEAQRLMTLVGDIIRLSRLEEGGTFETNPEPISLRQIAWNVQQQLQVAADRMGVSISITGDEGTILTSARIAEEIVYNLCDNAVKYNRKGGTVEISISQEDAGAVLQVRDTGIGIPKDELPRIFERFYRVDKSHSKELGGTGLGLSIVKHGAICLGAKVEIDSTLGSGTTVTISFPDERPSDHTTLLKF